MERGARGRGGAEAFGQNRLGDRPRDRRAGTAGRESFAQEQIIEEFLEGLLEGFRMAGVGHRADLDFAADFAPEPKGSWQDLDEVPKVDFSLDTPRKLQSMLSRPEPAGSPPGASPPSLSTSMRRHALRAFLDETCGTVANSFDIMAGLALKASLGGSGTVEDRLRHSFREEDFRLALMGLGYGLGGKDAWWSALFEAMDVDGDGTVSLQDMYDALVLALPPEAAAPNVFFTEPHSEVWCRPD
ncbi:unnamed protein product [Effrenium voratum]|nr:unnamed protein product [Effrenium voratum]